MTLTVQGEVQRRTSLGMSERQIAAELGISTERVREAQGKGRRKSPSMRVCLVEACKLLEQYYLEREMSEGLREWWAAEKLRRSGDSGDFGIRELLEARDEDTGELEEVSEKEECANSAGD